MKVKNRLTLQQQGLTLIELMIAMALGIGLTAAGFQIFLSLKQIFHTQQALMHIQENARAIEVTLGKLIRQSGSLGCNQLGSELALFIHPEVSADYGLEKRMGIFSPSIADLKVNSLIPKYTENHMRLNSDILWITYAEGNRALQAPTQGEQGDLVVNAPFEVKENDVIVVSDCSHVDFLKIAEKSISLKEKEVKISLLSKHYQHAQVNRLSSVVIYVAETGRINENNYPIYSLYSKKIPEPAEEWVEGIEEMKVEYGTLTQDGIHYLSSKEISNKTKIKSIRIQLLLTSVGAKIMRSWWTYEWAIKG